MINLRNVTSIRILPMNDTLAPNPEDYFKYELPKEQKGNYHLTGRKLLNEKHENERNALILFQHKSSICAYAILREIEDAPPNVDYDYSLYFYINSIKWLKKSITLKDINRILPRGNKIKQFSNAKRRLPFERIIESLIQLINSKKNFIIKDPISPTSNKNNSISFSKKTLLKIESLRKKYSIKEDQYQAEVNNPKKTDLKVSKWGRKISTGKRALKTANFLCENTNKNEKHVTFKSKCQPHNQFVECHHLIPMEYQDDFENNCLDRVENIVALCPNCHRKIHHGMSAEVNKILKSLFDKKSDKLKEQNLNIDYKRLKSYYKI